MRVLIVHASLGAGHRRAAQALQEVFAQQNIQVEVQDLLDFLPGPLKGFYPWAYYKMTEDARWLWRKVYDVTNKSKSPYTPATSVFQKWQFNNLQQYIQKEKFTDIICTHFTPAALLTDWRRLNGWNVRLYSVITDFIAHRCWLRKGLDQYFVPTETLSKQLCHGGFAQDSITVSGIPISLVFSRRLPKDEAKATCGVELGTRVLLVLTSGLNLKVTKALIEDLRELKGDFHYLVSAGRDGERVQRIQEFCRGDDRFIIFGFSPKVPQMMNAADLVVSKPGGLIVSEATAMGLPQLLFSPIPGQEEANADYLVKKNAAICIEAKRGEFKKALKGLLDNLDRLMAMSKAAEQLGHPDAAKIIVTKVVESDRHPRVL
jgi:processive 1,2-diacylglycerol beta-glucosyltransferase